MLTTFGWLSAEWTRTSWEEANSHTPNIANVSKQDEKKNSRSKPRADPVYDLAVCEEREILLQGHLLFSRGKSLS